MTFNAELAETAENRLLCVLRGFCIDRRFRLSCFRVFVVAFVLVAAVQAQDLSVTPIARDGRVLVSFDRTVASVTIEASVRFDNLTRRYQVSRTVDGRVEDAPPTEDQQAVRRWLTHFEQVPLSNTSTLETNGEYSVRVRAHTRPRNNWFFWPSDRGGVFGQAKFTFIP